jgi:GT2 family glycosyltransferase
MVYACQGNKKINNSSLLYAIVLNWNRAEDTITCIKSLFNQEGLSFIILLVDNGSTDDSVQQIKTNFPQLKIIVNLSNLGFGRGINKGIRYALDAGAGYVFIINNDAYLEVTALATLLDHISDDVGILAPMVYYASHPEKIWSIGGRSNLLNLETVGDARGQIDLGNWPDTLEKDFVTGCAMLIPRHTFERVGLFDERFHMYYEDADFCRNIRDAGLRILVVPKAKAWHRVSLSSGGGETPNERYWMARSSILFFAKHARGIQWPAIFFWRLGSSIRTSLRLLRKRRWQSLAAYWRGLIDGLQAAFNIR